MPLPELLDAEITWVIQQVAEYIDRQRQVYRGKAVPPNAGQKTAMQPFFPASTLDSASVIVLSGEQVTNPHFYPELQRMGFDPGSLPDFSHMAANTFVDTVVSHEAFTGRLLFHELVHVVQYEKLGLGEFAAPISFGPARTQAKGTPFSLRMLAGRPRSLKSRSNTVKAYSSRVEERASQVSRNRLAWSVTVSG
ncbi:MAG: hypothetical protein WBL63_26275 [Candidatus Acidiferrum sp.]